MEVLVIIAIILFVIMCVRSNWGCEPAIPHDNGERK
jgi:hypothetical protein